MIEDFIPVELAIRLKDIGFKSKTPISHLTMH